MGFAPADDPQIVVYVAVDNPKGTISIWWDSMLLQLLAKLWRMVLWKWGLEPRKNQIEKENKWRRPLIKFLI